MEGIDHDDPKARRRLGVLARVWLFRFAVDWLSLAIIGWLVYASVMGFNDLVRDARISRALGVREIVVFQLDGALKVFGEDFVRRFAGAVNDASQSVIVVSFSRPVSTVFYAMALADALLDVRGPRVWIWIGWIVLSSIIARRWNREK